MSSAATSKVDFKKELDAYRARPGEFRLVQIPEMHYLMIDGAGDPNTAPAFSNAVEMLYPFAYGLKFASKREFGRDYVVPPLEGLWWAEQMEHFTTSRDKSHWIWTLMIMVPEWIGRDSVEATRDRLRSKTGLEDIDAVRFEPLDEGSCMQTLHLGAFDDEADVLARMHDEEIPGRGLRMTGRHHEIYLSDARRVAPEKRRTILRQPVAE